MGVAVQPGFFMLMGMSVTVVMMMLMASWPVRVAVGMDVRITLPIGAAIRAHFEAHFAVSASANSAHQSTSNSLIRSSSPPVTCK